MIAALKNSKNIFWFLVIVACASAAWYLCYTVSIVSSHHIFNDSTFSMSLSKSISGLIDQKVNLSAKKLFKELKSDFPMVDEIEVHRMDLNKVYVQVFAADLVWRLGNAFVLSSKGEVFLSTAFKASVLRNLPKLHMHISLESEADIGQSQKSFLLNLPDFVMQDYKVHWYSKNKIILIKDYRQILIRHDQALTQDILDTCNKLFDDYQRHANKTCKGTIKADIRFDGQVIVSC